MTPNGSMEAVFERLRYIYVALARIRALPVRLLVPDVLVEVVRDTMVHVLNNNPILYNPRRRRLQRLRCCNDERCAQTDVSGMFGKGRVKYF